MIVQAFNWWSEGLAAGLSGFAGGFGRVRGFRLQREGTEFVLRAPDATGEAPGMRFGEGIPPADIRQQTRGSVIEIPVPAAAILERRLDLPGESRPFVENVVR